MAYSNEQFEFINELKKKYDDNGYEIQDEGLYEWKINNWNIISNEESIKSPNFNGYKYKWNLKLNPRGTEENNWEYISINMSKPYNELDFSLHIPVRLVFFVRDYNNYSKFYCETLPIQYFTSTDDEETECAYGLNKFIKISDFYKRYLFQNNKCIFGVYFSIYLYTKNQFKNEIYASLFDKEEKKNIVNKGFYEWKIQKWKSLSKQEKSPSFLAAGHNWILELYRKGFDKEYKGYISLFLKCTDLGDENLSVKFSFFIRNYDDPECLCYKIYEDYVTYFSDQDSWGITNLISKSDVLIKSKYLNKAIIENNRCIVGVFFQIYKEKKDIYLISNVVNETKLGVNNYRMEKGKNESREEIKTDMREEIKKELKKEIEKELREEIEKELRGKIEKELREKIEKEIREKIENENSNKIQMVNYIPYQQYQPQYNPPPYYYPVTANANVNPNPNLNQNQTQNVIQNPNPNVVLVNPYPSPPPPNSVTNPNNVYVNSYPSPPPPNPVTNPNNVYVNSYPSPPPYSSSSSSPSSPPYSSPSPSPSSPCVNPSVNQSDILVNNPYSIPPNLNSNPILPVNVNQDQKVTTSVDEKK